MFNSKVTSFKDEVLTYEKYPVVTSDMLTIDEHTVTMDIERWCIVLVSALRYVLGVLRITPRMSTTESDIKTNDPKVLGSRLVLALKCLKLDSNVQCDRFRLFRKDPISAMEDGSTFKYIDTFDIEFFDGDKKIEKRIIDRCELAGLEIGKYIEVTGEVNRHNVISGGVPHTGISRFARYLKYDKNEIGKSYSGSLKIVYEDNVPGIEVIKSGLNIIANVITDVLDEKKIKINYGNFSIEIENDREGILCTLVDHYMVRCSEDIISTNRKIIDTRTIMDFRDVEENVLFPILEKARKAINDDIKSIISGLH